MVSIAEQSRRPSGQRRWWAPERAEVLQVAADLFARRGYRTTTMQDLADELGISKATLYTRTRSKTEVLIGILEQWTEAISRDLDTALRDPSPSGQVRTLLTLWTERAITMQSHCAVCALFATDHELPADVLTRYRKWQDDIQARETELVVLAQQLGVVRHDVDPTVAALTIINAPQWAADRLIKPGLYSVDQAVEHILNIFISGLFAPDAPTEVQPATR
jgi:AcrR family transcriptional regulator